MMAKNRRMVEIRVPMAAESVSRISIPARRIK